MRGLVALYSISCSEEGVTSNSELLQFFRKVDMVEEQEASAAATISGEAGNTNTNEQKNATAQSRAFMRAAFPATLHLAGLSEGYLGDAGTAAVLRSLPFMRWVRRIEAREVGAGARTAAALSAVLALTEEVEIDIEPERHANDDTVDTDGSTTTTIFNNETKMTTTVTLTLPAVPLEYVDLSGDRYNALFAGSARQVLEAVRARDAVARRAAAALSASGASAEQRERLAAIGIPPHSPVVLLEPTAIPATIAKGLRVYSDAAARAAERRVAAARAEVSAYKRGLFCSGLAGRQQPTGEQVIYRVPETFPALPDAAQPNYPYGRYTRAAVRPTELPFYDPANTSAAALAAALNEWMEAYLVAQRSFTARDALNPAESTMIRRTAMDRATFPSSSSPSAWAAAQLCVDLGAEVLPAVTGTEAVVWLTLGVERLAALESHSNSDNDVTTTNTDANSGDGRDVSGGPDALAREREEVLYGVGRLLRGLISNPHLEDELVLFAQADSGSATLLRRHLRRMKELYYCFTAGILGMTDDSSGDKVVSGGGGVPRSVPRDDIEELRGLYLRVASALVAGPFTADKLPSLLPAEARIAEIRTGLIDYMLDGIAAPSSLSSPSLPSPPASAAACSVNDSPDPTTTTTTPKGTFALPEARRCLPLLCSAIKYFKANSAAESTAWNRRYLGLEQQQQQPAGSSSSGTTAETATTTTTTDDNVSNTKEAEALEFFLRPFAACTCVSITALREGSPAGARPCPACCHAALGALHAVLADGYVLRREALLAPLRLYLPPEVKLFMLDMILHQQRMQLQHHRGDGKDDGWRGGAYVPSLFGLPSSLQAFTTYQQRIQDGQRAKGTVGGSLAPDELVSVVDFFAYIDGDRGRLAQFLEAFSEWYRLNAIENFDCRIML